MRLPLLLCVTSLVATTALAQRESSPSSSPSSKAGSPGASSQPGASTSSQSDTTLSATGRGSGYSGHQQHLRSTKVIGAQVKTSAGEDVGRIEDVVLNPTSGRIDFAVISAENKLCPVPWQLLSVSGQGGQGSQSSTTQGTSSSTTPSTTPGTTPSTSSSTSPSSSGIYASASGSMGQPTFTLNVDKSKLQQGPSFDRSRWPDMSQSWSQRIYSHYGVQAESGVGGTGSGSFKSSTGSQSDQGSSGSSSDTSSGKSSSDSDSPKSGSDSKK